MIVAGIPRGTGARLKGGRDLGLFAPAGKLVA